MALFVREITPACFCRISQHQQVYLSTIEYQRASLRILPIENYNLPFMRPKIRYLSSLLVTCHQSSRLYGVFKFRNFREDFILRSFVKIKSLLNRQITLSITDIGKSCHSHIFLHHKYVFNTIHENKILTKISLFTVVI